MCVCSDRAVRFSPVPLLLQIFTCTNKVSGVLLSYHRYMINILHPLPFSPFLLENMNMPAWVSAQARSLSSVLQYLDSCMQSVCLAERKHALNTFCSDNCIPETCLSQTVQCLNIIIGAKDKCLEFEECFLEYSYLASGRSSGPIICNLLSWASKCPRP